MIPPTGAFPAGELYPPSAIGMPPTSQPASSNPSFNFVPPSNIPGYPHPLYSMNSAYDYNNAYGNIPQNYPPFNSSSVLFFKGFFLYFFWLILETSQHVKKLIFILNRKPFYLSYCYFSLIYSTIIKEGFFLMPSLRKLYSPNLV